MMDNWISIADEMPDIFQEVLGYKQGVGMLVVRATEHEWVETWDDADITGITHWMRLPEEPKQDK